MNKDNPNTISPEGHESTSNRNIFIFLDANVPLLKLGTLYRKNPFEFVMIVLKISKENCVKMMNISENFRQPARVAL